MVKHINFSITFLQLISCRLILITVVYVEYYQSTWECENGGDYVRAYIIGMMALLSFVIIVLCLLINRSAQGSVTDVEARKHVPPILLLKIFLIIPECVLNVFGTMWAFCGDLVVCPYEGHFSRTVIEGKQSPSIIYLQQKPINQIKKCFSL